METVSALFEFQIFKLQGEWHVTCGCPLKRFTTKREAVLWCRRAKKSFKAGKDSVHLTDDGEGTLTPEYAVSALLKNILMQVE
jgi:hypothetical protein